MNLCELKNSNKTLVMQVMKIFIYGKKLNTREENCKPFSNLRQYTVNIKCYSL